MFDYSSDLRCESGEPVGCDRDWGERFQCGLNYAIALGAVYLRRKPGFSLFQVVVETSKGVFTPHPVGVPYPKGWPGHGDLSQRFLSIPC